MKDEPMLKYLRLNVKLAMFVVILLAGCTPAPWYWTGATDYSD